MTTLARERMRQLLQTERCITCASVFDPLSSRMAESIGFEAGILGGSVASLLSLGAPDIYLLTLNELATQAKRVCRASHLPMIVDGDSGYGNSLNVMRTIEELEDAGAALVTLEDTVIPQPFQKPEFNLSSIEEACNKLKAALEARNDNSMAIFARTHADQPIEQLQARVEAYSKVGVDGICIFGCKSKQRLAQWASNTTLPIMLISYGEVDLGSADHLAKQNVRISFSGHTAYEEAVKATYQSLLRLYSGSEEGSKECDAKALISRFSEKAKYQQIAKQFICNEG